MTDLALPQIPGQNAPAPLQLQHVVISPRNIELQKRAAVAKPLAKAEKRQREKRLKQLEQLLQHESYDELIAAREQIAQIDLDAVIELQAAARDELAILEDLTARDSVDRGDDMQPLLDILADCAAKIDLANEQHKVNDAIALFEERRLIVDRLREHSLAVKRQAQLDKQTKLMAQEVDDYRALIIDRWTRLGYCHRYQKGTRTYVEKVSFSDVFITPDAIYYKINTSRKTLFGGWKTCLPYGVRVGDHLLNESTLVELSTTCQRQVTGLVSPTGAWVVVHRLDTIDGLMSYVTYRAIMQYYPTDQHDKIPIPIGVGISKTMQWINLSEFPHGLIAGYTGSGKSNAANVVLCSIISRQSPQDVRLCLIDLKGGLEFDYYEQVPHVHKMVTSIEAVRDTLAEIEGLIVERFEIMRGIAKNVDVYNARCPENRLPRVLIFFDEVASIMDHGETTKTILASMREISRLGRAVGVHLWLATQRPDIKAIEGAIKVNLAVRLSGRMPSSSDSITVLGTGDASKLAAVPGRMVLQLGPDPTPVQTPHIVDQDVEDAILQAMTWRAPAPLPIPEAARVIHQEWTPERIARLAITHLDGNISAHAVWNETNESLSQRQARELVEKVWQLAEEGIEIDEVTYVLKRGKGKNRRLVPLIS
ncbi:MAG: hypothetical protein KJ065_09295 [Anaerolineae bacterium]|nr:hypothetical protein [Anaerolineae bacterium]